MQASISAPSARAAGMDPDLKRFREAWYTVPQVALWAIALILIIAVAALEPKDPGGADKARTPAWAVQLQRMDEALARQDIGHAIRPWNMAYSAALKSEGWEGLAAVGEAHLRLARRIGNDKATALPVAAPIVVRGIYESVLARASQQKSVQGVLCAAEGFVAIGDQVRAVACAEAAGRLAGMFPDPQVQRRLGALRDSAGSPEAPGGPR